LIENSAADRSVRRTVAGGAALLLGAWAVYWWLAVPRHDICPLTLPAPAGCGSGRVPVATFWTVGTGVLYGLTLLLAVLRPDRRWWFTGLLGLVVAAVRGWYSVLYA
jgi:hypothetical protein